MPRQHRTLGKTLPLRVKSRGHQKHEFNKISYAPSGFDSIDCTGADSVWRDIDSKFPSGADAGYGNAYAHGLHNVPGGRP